MTGGERCPKCSAETRPGQLFCGRCGERVSQACPACATLNAAGAAFCEHCGAAMHAPASTPPTAPTAPGWQSSGNSAACPRCRTVNEMGAAYCFNCGLPMEKDSAQGPRLTPVSPYEGSTGARFPGMDAGIIDRPAGFWIRAVASLIEVGPYMLVLLIVASITGELEQIPEEGTTVAEIITGLIHIAYYMVALSVYSATIGKRLLGIYVLRPDGSKVGPGRALARYFAGFLSFIILLIGYLMVAFREDKRALHDIICDTVVVYKR